MLFYLKKYSKQNILIINIVIVLCSILILYEDLKYYGNFQLTRQDRIEDGEEAYLNVTSLILIIFGVITLMQLLIKKEKLNYIFLFSNIFYGAIMLLFGFFSSLMFIATISELSILVENILLQLTLILCSFLILIFGIKLIFKCNNLKSKLT